MALRYDPASSDDESSVEDAPNYPSTFDELPSEASDDSDEEDEDDSSSSPSEESEGESSDEGESR